MLLVCTCLYMFVPCRCFQQITMSLVTGFSLGSIQSIQTVSDITSFQHKAALLFQRSAENGRHETQGLKHKQAGLQHLHDDTTERDRENMQCQSSNRKPSPTLPQTGGINHENMVVCPCCTNIRVQFVIASFHIIQVALCAPGCQDSTWYGSARLKVCSLKPKRSVLCSALKFW